MKVSKFYKKYSFFIETEKSGEFQLNLLNLDTQALGIPDTDYPTTIKMSSSEFVSLCRDFTNLSDCVKIEVKDDKCTFFVNGKAGNGKYYLKNILYIILFMLY